MFDSPHDAVVLDTGHQSYVHKLLTAARTSPACAPRGLSGYPSRAESPHDVVENSHASTSLSWAHGIAAGRVVRGERNRHTVAVIGDGALTGGMAWEAINNIAPEQDLPLVIVVNDNERSYPRPAAASPTTSRRCARPAATSASSTGASATSRARTPVGAAMYETLHGVKKGIKDIVAPQGCSRTSASSTSARSTATTSRPSRRRCARPRRSAGGARPRHHAEGRGYDPAVSDEADQFHAVGVINPETGLPLEIAGRSWTDEFSDTMGRSARSGPTSWRSPRR